MYLKEFCKKMAQRATFHIIRSFVYIIFLYVIFSLIFVTFMGKIQIAIHTLHTLLEHLFCFCISNSLTLPRKEKDMRSDHCYPHFSPVNHN